MILAVGNDRQFRDWCTAAGADDLKDDERFKTNPLRIKNREVLYQKNAQLHETENYQRMVVDNGGSEGSM